jgi:hypothetical protein
MLKQRGMGVPLSDTVKNLSETYGVSRRAIYYDWQRRTAWMRALLEVGDPEQFALDVIAHHLEIRRFATLEYLKGDNSAARIGALRLIRNLNLDLNEMLVTQDLITRVEQLEEMSR